MQDTRRRIGIGKISIHITGESTEIKRHQTSTKNKSTEMLCTVNAIVRTLTSDLMKQLEETKMWFIRIMLRISYKDRVTNEEVLRRANVDRTLVKDIVKRQMKLFGHVIRKEELEKFVVTGFIKGKRARGRQRETYLTYLQKMKGMTPIELIHLAYERDIFI